MMVSLALTAKQGGGYGRRHDQMRATAAAAGAEPVSLRGGGDEVVGLGDKMVTWVCPGPLRAYVKEMAHKRSTPTNPVKERDVYIGALELDRTLEEGLQNETARLRAFAEAQGLPLGARDPNFEQNYRKVILQLVKAGLDAADAKHSKKGGK
jgi:hypothetical protein